MEGYALSYNNRISVKKIKRVALNFRNMKYLEAVNMLVHLPQKGAYILRKVLHSAAANLQNAAPGSPEADWRIKEIQLNQGPVLKRVKPRARGRADRISRPTTHLKVVISDGK